MSDLCEEEKIFLAVARAQGALVRGAIRVLRADKTDGIRVVGWMDKHRRFLYEIARWDGISEEVRKQAEKLALEEDLS